MAVLSLFPPGSALDDDGMLTVGGCRADDLAEEFGTPVLVVAEAALRDRAREYARELAARWPRSRVVFASKAFPCTAVQRVMVEEGLGIAILPRVSVERELKLGQLVEVEITGVPRIRRQIGRASCRERV